MEILQLRYFLTICKTLNFSRAAEELYISQPTLSQQIKRLERELNVQLFARSTRSVELTEVGRLCADYAAQAISAVDGIQTVAQEYRRKESRNISIGVLVIYPQMAISSAITEYQLTHPEIKTSLVFDWSVNLIEMLIKKKVDIVLCNTYANIEQLPEWDQLHVQVFQNDELLVVINKKHPLANRKVIDVRQLHTERIYFPNPKASVLLLLQQAAKLQGVQLPYIEECPSMTTLFNFVNAGLGISIMSKHVANAYMHSDIRCIPLSPVIPAQTAVFVRKKSLQRASIREFYEYFINCVNHTEL